jgi:hypothetical protein
MSLLLNHCIHGLTLEGLMGVLCTSISWCHHSLVLFVWYQGHPCFILHLLTSKNQWKWVCVFWTGVCRGRYDRTSSGPHGARVRPLAWCNCTCDTTASNGAEADTNNTKSSTPTHWVTLSILAIQIEKPWEGCVCVSLWGWCSYQQHVHDNDQLP